MSLVTNKSNLSELQVKRLFSIMDANKVESDVPFLDEDGNINESVYDHTNYAHFTALYAQLRKQQWHKVEFGEGTGLTKEDAADMQRAVSRRFDKLLEAKLEELSNGAHNGTFCNDWLLLVCTAIFFF